MDASFDTDELHSQSSLTRMIYAFCAGVIVYWLLDYTAQVFFKVRFARPSASPDLYRWSYYLSYYLTSACFFAAMLLVATAYRFKAEDFRCRKDTTEAAAGWVKSIPVGILGGIIALLIVSPTIWYGWDTGRLRSIELLIADALSPVRLIVLLSVVLALAFSSEIVFRGIVFRTLARHTTIPAAALVSCLLFACLFPVLGIIAAILLAATSSILYWMTKGLIAPILANALFITGCSGIALYHRLM